MDEGRAEEEEGKTAGRGDQGRKTKKAKKDVGAKRVIKIEQSKQSVVLEAMRSDAKLLDLGADVRSIRRTCTGEMILELKRDKERKGAACKSLVEEVLGEGV